MNTNMVSFEVMLSVHIYSCAIELEYSFHVIILTYELAYSLCVMILTCSFDTIISYELDYSFYAMILSYRTLCLIVHTIHMMRIRAKLRWLLVFINLTLDSVVTFFSPTLIDILYHVVIPGRWS
jgi:hypothetical protein